MPRDLLVALAYAETHLDGHNGEPSASNGYGVMHLVSNPTNHSLEKAAELTGLPADKLKADDEANVLGGAAVLRSLADKLGLDATARKDPGDWYRAVAQYGNASSPSWPACTPTPSTSSSASASTCAASRSSRRRSPPTAASTPASAT
ncbi:hypothetical protein ACFQQB_21830 [Nonomuraea rubra]|uniref:hypothetical protein n=1 Tax=Nonomuraea rubra TaxID=46180 RepID=UPI00360762C8